MTDRNRGNIRTVQLDESFRPGVNSIHINSHQHSQQQRTKLSGYQPLIMENSLANTVSRHNTLRPSLMQNGPKQARDIVLKPGFEAKAEAQNLKLSQQQKYSTMFKNLPEGEKYKNADLNFHQNDDAGLSGYNSAIQASGFRSTYMAPPNNFRNAQSAEYIAELEKQLGEIKLENNQMRRTIVAYERQIDQFDKENKYVQGENSNLLKELASM